MKHKQRIGDKMVTTIEEPAIIQYDDVKAGCRVESDECGETPWETGDGWNHHLDGTGQDIDASECNAVIRHNRDYSGKMIVLDDCGLPDWRYYHAAGASKQRARELEAKAKRRAIAQLVTWYNDGWEWYGAVCKFTTDDGTDYWESVWGIDDYDYAKECAETDMLSEVIASLEKDGYEVVGKPTETDWRKEYLKNRHVSLQYNIHSQDMEQR